MPAVRVTCVLALLALTGCLFGGSFGNPNEKQTTYKRSLLVKPKKPAKQRWLANVRTVNLRVYAGHELRTQRLDWKARLRRLVAQANPILERELRLRLVVAFAKPWQRKAPSDNMAAMVSELEELDPGDETEWVLGLVTPLAYTTPSLHELGVARVNGRHMVMRSASVIAQSAHNSLGKPEDIELVTLLHEVGHILGALHARDERNFMFPEMREGQKEYDRDRAKRMMSKLQARFTKPAKPALEQKTADPKQPKPDRTSGVMALINSANTAPNRAKALQILRTAAARLEVLKLDDDGVWLELASGFAAQQALSSAEDALRRMKKPKPKHATARWVITTRARAALPRTGAGAIPAAQEPRYIELVSKLIGLVTSGDAAKTSRLMRKVSRRYPRSAGLAVARCYRAIYTHQVGAARRHCKRALALHPGSSWANYLLGFLELRRKRPGKAAAWMKKALAVDPYLEPAWRDLAKIYIEVEDTAGLNKLVRDYESTFDRPMRL